MGLALTSSPFSGAPASQIRFFFEKKAFTDGKLNRPKELAINKVC